MAISRVVVNFRHAWKGNAKRKVSYYAESVLSDVASDIPDNVVIPADLGDIEVIDEIAEDVGGETLGPSGPSGVSSLTLAPTSRRDLRADASGIASENPPQHERDRNRGYVLATRPKKTQKAMTKRIEKEKSNSLDLSSGHGHGRGIRPSMSSPPRGRGRGTSGRSRPLSPLACPRPKRAREGENIAAASAPQRQRAGKACTSSNFIFL